MSVNTRGKKRDTLVYVLVNVKTYYGWKRKDLSSLAGITEADLTTIGHLKAEGATLTPGNIIIIGAKAPQPARITRRISTATVGQQQSVSTFCAHDKTSAALGAKWSISESKKAVNLQAPSASKGSHSAIAILSDGSRYCFPMNKADFDTYGAELGLTGAATITTAAERNTLVSGSTRPKPGRATKRLEDGSTFSCYFSTDKQGDMMELGYSIREEEMVIAVPGGQGA